MPYPARLGAAVVALGAFAAGMWFAWLGWDHEYYLVDGVAQGPYRAWQVIGCGGTVVVAAVLAQLWVGRTVSVFLLAAAAIVGFAIPWSADAASSDETGLWAVGLVSLLVGGGLGLVAVLALTEMAAQAATHRSLPTRRPPEGRPRQAS